MAYHLLSILLRIDSIFDSKELSDAIKTLMELHLSQRQECLLHLENGITTKLIIVFMPRPDQLRALNFERIACTILACLFMS